MGLDGTTTSPGPPRRLRATLLLLVLVLLAGCGGGEADGAGRQTVTVFAAASLTEALPALADAFQKQHPGTRVVTSFAGSQTLVAQVQQGARADLVVTADERTLGLLRDRLDGDPRIVATNTLAVVTPAGNPQRVLSLGDLARPGVKVVLGAPSVPVGAAARAALSAQHLTVRPVSEEPDVKAVLAKVRLGEADAGIVYATDLRAAGTSVTGFPLEGVSSRYPAAVVKGAENRRGARALLAFALSPGGQDVLRRFGFGPPA